MRRSLLVALGLLCAPAAWAQDPPADPLVPLEPLAPVVDPAVPAAVRYTGRIVALRSLVAPRGGLPAESLEPLLRVQQEIGRAHV